jgi:HlyD family secretion protein
MKNKILFGLSLFGIVLGFYSAYVFSQRPPTLPPVFNPAANPYEKGIYANGIVESLQPHGENINIYPEVSGPITHVLVAEGERVHQGDVLLMIEDSVQRATVAQLEAQAKSAGALLEELKAQPRPENLEIAKAQVDFARATLKNAKDQLAKQQHAYELAPGAVSIDTLDNARNAMAIAEQNLGVVQSQYDLTKAGAWIFEITSQQNQHEALNKAYLASAALLSKYTLRAPVDGVILSIEAAQGTYVSSQGAYGSYTQGYGPLIVMGTPQDTLEVRCYVDEILVSHLPTVDQMTATMCVPGTDVRIPLTFERMQPYVSPKIELSNQRLERVDVRVLPVIFRFTKPPALQLYPGQLVDVYIGQK